MAGTDFISVHVLIVVGLALLSLFCGDKGYDCFSQSNAKANLYMSQQDDYVMYFYLKHLLSSSCSLLRFRCTRTDVLERQVFGIRGCDLLWKGCVQAWKHVAVSDEQWREATRSSLIGMHVHLSRSTIHGNVCTRYLHVLISYRLYLMHLSVCL